MTTLDLRKTAQEIGYVIDVRLSGLYKLAEFLGELIDFRGVFYDAELVTDHIWHEKSTPQGHTEITIGHKFDNERDANNFFDDIKMFLVEYREEISGSIIARQSNRVVDSGRTIPNDGANPGKHTYPNLK